MVSARALSQESLTLPTEGSMPASARRWVYLIETYWAGSTGRRNTFSLTGLQALVQRFGGSSPSEGLAGPCIERVSNNLEYVRTVCAQIGSFREVLSKQSISVLVRSALPRAVRFAEVDGKAGCDPQIRMPGHLCSLVPGQRAAKVRWQCRDRPGDGIANPLQPHDWQAQRPVLHARDGCHVRPSVRARGTRSRGRQIYQRRKILTRKGFLGSM